MAAALKAATAGLEAQDRLTGADRSADKLHPWGVAQLLLGQYDEAVASLEEAAAAKSSDPLIQTDLSAAYLARFSALGRADDLPRALDAAARGRDLAPTLPEAVFAYALALEDLHLVERSREAWRAYLALDATSGWIVVSPAASCVLVDRQRTQDHVRDAALVVFTPRATPGAGSRAACR